MSTPSGSGGVLRNENVRETINETEGQTNQKKELKIVSQRKHAKPRKISNKIKAICNLQVRRKQWKKQPKLIGKKTPLNLNNFTKLTRKLTKRSHGEKKNGRKVCKYTEDDKLQALILYKQSPNTYSWLQKKYILPSPAMLSKIILNMDLEVGQNLSLFEKIKKKVKYFEKDEKLCILLFDKMPISSDFDKNCDTDVTNDKKPQKCGYALVFMIRGIVKRNKQPVAYTICPDDTSKIQLANIIKDVIRKLNNVGLKVLATVCSHSASNINVINYLIHETKANYLREKVVLQKDIFEVDGNEVVPLYDPSHLIKGVRNHLMTKNLICSIDGSSKQAKWENIVQLSQKVSIKQLTEEHVKPDKMKTMKKTVYAAQIFSGTVGGFLKFTGKMKDLEEFTQTADVILFFDSLFDSLNGNYEDWKEWSDTNPKDLLSTVTAKSKHIATWAEAKQVLRSMKFIVNDGGSQVKISVPTINCWLHTICNAEYLIGTLSSTYKIKKVWMSRFNEDPLENLFATIKKKCGNKCPSAAQFETTFAEILKSNKCQYTYRSNCQNDRCFTLLNDNPKSQSPWGNFLLF